MLCPKHNFCLPYPLEKTLFLAQLVIVELYNPIMKLFHHLHINLPKRASRVFTHNSTFFFLGLALCAGILVFILILGEQRIKKIDDQVIHTYSVINNAQELSMLVEGMLAAQRAFILTNEEKFIIKLHNRRDEGSKLIAHLSELIGENKSQSSRLDELRHHFNEFSIKLEQRAQTITISSPTKFILDDLETVDGIKDNILRINSDILREEYDLLNTRIDEIEAQKSKYFAILLIGIIITSAGLFFFNGFLLRTQKRQSRTEASLKNTQERLELAIEGTQDGIFDWDLKTGQVFYSGQFFKMLGYDRESSTSKIDDFKQLLHPEDAARTQNYIEQYLDGKISEYVQEFRLKGANGSWVWINAHAKAIFGVDGKPLRMVGAHTNVTLAKEAEERLKAEKTQAEKENRAKSDFLAHMSHEIRTPLTSISGIAEIFEKNQDILNTKQKKLIRTLHSSVTILKDLINDILDFSKIASGELELQEESFRLCGLFEEIVSMIALRANQKGVSFVFDYKDVKDINFYGDSQRLRQILINLIGNALKFTEEGGITIKAYTEKRKDNNILRIDVTDTGIGIAPENFDLVFERFKQADSSVSRKYGGTGLGLSISKNLAKLMNGDIILTSQLGKGSTFSVLLPMKLDRPEESKKGSEKINDQIKGALSKNKKILVVEDYEGNVVVLSHILEEMGFVGCDIARSGIEALALWEEKNYDLILMDVQMPEMDGLTATGLIRKKEKTEAIPYTPIIGMTAHALVEDKEKCITSGMDAYLPKPLVVADLKKEILKYVNKKQEAA